ncbi:MAG: hypothetical protein ACKPKO_61705, partial [Candidatus Fonsibacter sp.]
VPMTNQMKEFLDVANNDVNVNFGCELMRGGGKFVVSDADTEKFYQGTIIGSGGAPPVGSVAAALIVEPAHGSWDGNGLFTKYNDQWQGPPRGAPLEAKTLQLVLTA